MIYIYSKKTGEILEIEDATILDSTTMDTLKAVHKEDIRNAFGRIVVENDTPVYRDTYINIIVDKKTNDFAKISNAGKDDENFYYTKVKNKDYITHTAINSLTTVSKYFNGSFHTFPKENDKIYDAKTNTFSLDLKLFKESIINMVTSCEDELRQHGFFHNLFGTETYVQPFRNANKENDQTVLLAQRVSTHVSARRIKIFTYDIEKRKRLTSPGEFYWIMDGQVSDTVLDALLTLIAGYSESVKAGIAGMIKKIEDTNNIDTLKDIKEKYVYMILHNMQVALESSATNKKLIEQVKQKIQEEKIILVKDDNFVGGSTY